MKSFWLPKLTLFAAFTLAITRFSAPAQNVPGGGDFNSSLLRLFGEHKAFTAKASLQSLDEKQTETVSTPVDISLLEDRARFDIDLTLMKSANMPPSAIAPLKASGMAHVVTVSRPDLKQVLVIYPDAKSMLRMPMADKDVQASKAPPKLEKAELGKETINGHPCLKHKVTLTDASGATIVATTWNASDLKDFPVQIQTTDKGKTVVIQFNDIKLGKPEAALFEVPTGYKEYKNTQEMMQEMMMKVMGGQLGR